jgi:protein tyrosine/serine phosphatase
MKTKSNVVTTILIAAFLLTGVVLLLYSKNEKFPAGDVIRNPKWAKPISLEGVPNLHQIDVNVYRSAQPTVAGFENLKKFGIKTVINLRAFHSDKDETAGLNLSCEEISFKTWHPEQEDIIKFIKIIQNKENGPFLIHCQHGADRTGMMSAIYRMYFQNWTKENAMDEMKNGGFGFHSVWQNIVEYLEGLNLEKIRQDANTPNK